MMQEPEFKRRLSEARTKLAGEIVTTLHANSLEAVAVLREVMSDKATPPASRVSAAAKLIELGLRAGEQLELRERVNALEATLKQRERVTRFNFSEHKTLARISA